VATLEADGTVTDAAAGLTRCEVALGVAPTAGRYEGGRALARGGGGGGGGGGGARPRVSEEDARALGEAQARVKDVKKQQMRSAQQRQLAADEKRRAELTLAQLAKLPAGRGVYAAVGRMYARSTPAAVGARLEEDRAGAEKKLRVCAAAIEHLARQEKEADAAFLELMAAVRRKGA